MNYLLGKRSRISLNFIPSNSKYLNVIILIFKLRDHFAPLCFSFSYSPVSQLLRCNFEPSKFYLKL